MKQCISLSNVYHQTWKLETSKCSKMMTLMVMVSFIVLIVVKGVIIWGN